ncbi:APOBEC1 complementation factor-like [Tribolium madens]|uniref:APOBEC1 complementation factor-like n=1 Tax=Tribolium madens TaxID=41895 RepID=UPI001CF72687|nr:APOBEC1 complementation factor-like [Tribolium madens]
MALSKDLWNLTFPNSLKNYQIIQVNGQRIYGPSASSGIRPPPKGTEIFIGNLPPDLYEDELIPLFSQKGAIYNLRLMLDFFGRNRGYGFISYFRQEDAHAAVAAFNHYKIRNKSRIAVSMSVDNRRLFIGNIPKNITLNEIQCVLEKFVEGIVDIILYPEPYSDNVNRGFVFVEFESHRLAAIARRQLSPGNLIIKEKSIFVDWAEPLPVVSPQIMKQVRKLYLSNLPPILTSDDLKSFLCELLNPNHIIKVHKMNNFAFVHFTLRRYAEEAFEKLTGLVIMNKLIAVEWARPIEYSKQHRGARLPDNFCKSVPPTLRRLVQSSVDMRNRSRQSRSSFTDQNSGTEYDFFSVLHRGNPTEI